MSTKTNIYVLGAGSWGTALAIHLAKNNHKVFLWGHEPQHIQNLIKYRENKQFLPNFALPENINCIDSLSSIKPNSLALLAVPSYAFKATLQLLKQNNWQANSGIAWATKGLDTNSHEFLHHIIIDTFGNQTSMAMLSGPTFAKEVANGLPTALTIAGNDNNFNNRWADLLNSTTFRCYLSNDIIGVEIAAATKNIIAIAAGVSDGLGFGANARSAIIARGLHEIMLLGQAYNANPQTFMGLAGVGDLSLTCSDDQSRNRQLGLLLAQNINMEVATNKINQAVEGANVAPAIKFLAEQKHIEMPITNEVVKLLNFTITPRQAANNLLNRK